MNESYVNHERANNLFHQYSVYSVRNNILLRVWGALFIFVMNIPYQTVHLEHVHTDQWMQCRSVRYCSLIPSANTARRPLTCPVVPALYDWWWPVQNEQQGKPKYSEKTCRSAILPTTNLGSNPGCCSGEPATNRARTRPWHKC
jgi:hypothetical protein